MLYKVLNGGAVFIFYVEKYFHLWKTLMRPFAWVYALTTKALIPLYRK